MMKNNKIGILTTHRVPNYGSLLQAYALQFFLSKKGYDTELIDYDFPTALHITQHSRRSEKRSLRDITIKIIFGYALYRQKKKYQKFLKERLYLSDTFYADQRSILDNPPQYDIYMVGSDQVWNPRYTNYDPVFLLSFVKTGICCSYASSLGVNRFDEKQESLFVKYLTQFSNVSVREKSSVGILEKLGVNNVVNCVDPTLLLSKNDWAPLIKSPRQKKKYILCYFLNYTFDAHPFVDNLAQAISEKTGYEIIRVARPPMYFSNKNTKYKVSASTEEFLGLIDNAELVLTTSYHGTLFSLNFRKPFYSIVKNVNDTDARLIDLLKTLNLSDRILDLKSDLPVDGFLDINYDDVTLELDKLISSSKQYLDIVLKND